MNTSIRRLALSLTLVAASLFGTMTTAGAQTVITSLPYTITSSGLYVLDADLNGSQTSGNLITVSASNVTIDLQGHYIAGPVGVASQSTIGIFAYEQSNLTIRNGTIAFCYIGVSIIGNASATTNSVGHQIDNMRVTYCYDAGALIRSGLASRITNCQVSQIGSSTANTAIGIAAGGAGTTISNNVVSTVTADTSIGISAEAGSFVRGNTISNATIGVSGGKYQDNLTANCTYPYNGGTDAGGNN